MSLNKQNHQDESNLLEMSQMVEFDATLGDLSDPDKRQQRILYLRGVRQRIGTGKSLGDAFGSFFKGMGLHLMPFAIIFLCLPMFFIAWYRVWKERALINNQLSRALDYWQIRRCDIA